jgi:hypothetical protein
MAFCADSMESNLTYISPWAMTALVLALRLNMTANLSLFLDLDAYNWAIFVFTLRPDFFG